MLVLPPTEPHEPFAVPAELAEELPVLEVELPDAPPAPPAPKPVLLVPPGMDGGVQPPVEDVVGGGWGGGEDVEGMQACGRMAGEPLTGCSVMRTSLDRLL